MRGNALPWLSREVDVVSWLTVAGVSVVPPWSDPGPFIEDGLEVTLWAWAEHTGDAVGQAAYGALLGQLHAVLERYDRDLPTLVGPITDVTVLHETAANLLPLAMT